mgnify:CR=1 FL=1
MIVGLHLSVCIDDSPRINLEMLLYVKRSVIVLVCADSLSSSVESVSKLRQRIMQALLYVPDKRLVVSPTCGLAALPEGE